MAKRGCLLGCLIVLIGIVFLCSNTFAQGDSVTLRTRISKIPDARILSWQCDDCTDGIPTIANPKVDEDSSVIGDDWKDGWQGQALYAGYTVMCPSDGDDINTHNYVRIALDRYLRNSVVIYEGSYFTIDEIIEGGVTQITQDTGETFFDLDAIGESEFHVETPTATIGVSGTRFRVQVQDLGGDPDLDTSIVILELGHDMTITEKGTEDESDEDQIEYTFEAQPGEQPTVINQEVHIIDGEDNYSATLSETEEVTYAQEFDRIFEDDEQEDSKWWEEVWQGMIEWVCTHSHWHANWCEQHHD